MIQATTETNFTAYIQTEDNRIKTSATSARIRHLLKFTNDMDGSVVYAYGTTETIYQRYTKLTFTYHATPDVYTGKVDLSAGYWKYEAYEVWFVSSVSLTPSLAPVTEVDVLSSEAAGVVKLNIIFAGTGYSSAPTILIAAPTSGRRATATCAIEDGKVISVTVTNQGWGYTEAPEVTISDGTAVLTASLKNNYIYYG